MSDPAREALVARLRPLTAGWPEDLSDSRRPAFFSRPSAGGGVTWYAVAHSPRQARELREYLLAFVGPSHSDFAGQAAEWDRADPVEAELAASLPHGFRLTPRVGDTNAVAKLFARLRQMLRERPARERSDPPPLGRLLRDFELLVRAADWPAAAVLLDRLRERGQLTPEQLAGLGLRLLAGQGRWPELLSAPELPALVTGRTPAAVAEAVAAAVFNEHLAKFPTEAEAAAHFREQVGPAFGLLFRQRTAWRHPDAVRAAAVADAAARALSAEPPKVPRDTFEAAIEANAAGDAATAFSLLAVGPFTAESLRLLVEVALDLGELDAARTALAAVQGCGAAIREKAFARRASRALLDELEEVAGTAEYAPPADWLAWLSRVAGGSLPDAGGAASRMAAQWPRPDPAAFNAALTEHIGRVFPAVRDALPAVLELLIPGGAPDARFGPSYRLLLERLVLDDDLSPATAPAVAELAAAVLRAAPVANPTRNDYRDVTEVLLAAWHHLRQPAMLDWGIGVLDLAAEHAIHRRADVTGLVQDVAAEFARTPRLVTAGQRALLRTICGELEVPAAAELLVAPPEANPAAAGEAAVLRKRLGRRRVVLLTLSDRIASAFRQLMREQYPDARADVVQEYSSTDRLEEAAVSADVFVVNTFDAKHAATAAVPRCRPASAPTLYPKGKNAARQLDALEDWLRSLA
jgi:hypothetical protein